MKETGFIEQNKAKWVDFEKHMLQQTKDPDKLSSEFIQVTDDLSYSRTFYPNRSVRVYLNNVAQRVFHSIYKNRSKRFSRFKEFWKEDLPHLVYDSRKNLLTALIVFVLSMAIGVMSSIYNPEFPRQILGDSYIEMTKANIQTGDPMAVYKKSSEIDMLLGITLNNLMVAALAFVMGVFFSIGTIGVLIVNGIMVGCFQYFFYEQGLFVESFLTIWLHGTLEISAIVIAGGAGLTLGSGMVFPGTYTRGQAFRIGAYRGMKIMMGIMPIICFAAIIESFITRYTDVPDWIKLTLILVSGAFIVGYFVVIPILKARSGFKKPLTEEKLPPSPDDKIRTETIRDTGEVFKDSFLMYRRIAGKLIPISVFMAVLYGIGYSLFFAPDTGYAFSLQAFGPMLIDNAFAFFGDIAGYFEYEKHPYLAPVNLIFFSVISFLFFFHYKRETGESELKMSFGYFIRHFWKSIFIGSLISSIFFLPLEGAGWLVVFVQPIFLVWLAVLHKEKINIFTSLGRAFDYAFGNFSRVYGIYLILLLVSFLSMAVISMPQLVWFAFEVLYWFIDIEGEVYWQFFVAFFTFISMASLAMVMPLFLGAYGILFFTLREIRLAEHLLKKVEGIGKPKPKKPMMYVLFPLLFGAFLLAPANTRAQEENEIQQFLDSMNAAIAVAADTSYEYNEYYQDSNYYYQQQEKKKSHQEYFNSEQKVKKLGDENWKKATEGLEYSEAQKKKKAKELDDKEESKYNGDLDLGGLFGGAGTAQVILFLLGAAVIGLILYFLIRNNLFKRNTNIGKKRVFTIEEAAEDIHESDLERFLRESLEKGDYKTAVRVYYLILIRELSEKELIRWKKDKTNREYLLEMRSNKFYQPFSELTRAFEYVWYGEVALVEKDFKGLQPHFSGLIEKVKSTSEE